MTQPLSPRRARSRRSPRGVFVLVSLIGIGALTGCGSTASASEGNGVKVALGAASGSRTVQAGDRLRVTASGGALITVTVTDPRGDRLSGALGRDGTVWTSRTRTAPDTKYSVVARTKDARGATAEVKESVTTAKADRPYGGKPAPPTGPET